MCLDHAKQLRQNDQCSVFLDTAQLHGGQGGKALKASSLFFSPTAFTCKMTCSFSYELVFPFLHLFGFHSFIACGLMERQP